LDYFSPPQSLIRFCYIFSIFGICILVLNGFVIYAVIAYFSMPLLFIAAITIIINCIYLYLYRAIYSPIKWIKNISRIEHNKHEEYFAALANYPVFSFLSDLLFQHQQSVNRKNEQELLNKQVQFRELQSQINPHFLYNTLESIRAQALLDNVPEIANMAKSLAAFFRYNISSSQNLVSLHEEIRNIQNYFSIQKYRFGDKLSMDIIYDDDDCGSNLLPKLTLQPILENAIYHGLETRMENGNICIKILTTQSRMLITVSDNGIGIEPEQITRINQQLNCVDYPRDHKENERSGIALQNINKRIRLCFGEQYGISVRSIPDVGTDVEIVLPLIKKMDWDMA